jgi:hypothetical protein
MSRPPQPRSPQAPRISVAGVPPAARTLMALLGGALLAVSASACETTQQESARIGRQAKAVAVAQSLRVGAIDRSVRVSDVTLLQGSEKDAVVVHLTNTSGAAKQGAPLLLEVHDAGGKVLYTNSTGGLEPALQRLPALPAHATLWWVDDQVTLSGKPAHVSVRVGSSGKAGASASTADASSIALSGVHVSQQNGGEVLSGVIANRSAAPLGKVAVFAAGLAGGRVRAAGRAIVSSLAAHASGVPFQIFLVGNSAGTSMQTTAVPVA